VSAFEQVLSQAAESVFTPESYYLLAECNSRLGNYAEAIEYYGYVADSWPDWDLAWCARFHAGRRYEQWKRAGGITVSEADVGSQTAYRQLLAQYPNCPAATAASNWLNNHSN
jgi:tetratricopeptide (TPR) repeat protein